ncbi:YVTN family beta-propeller repeat protein [Paracoccus sp. CPCC 101403]|uniref:YVTN family beta-propeller repeat protein n=1 Tax=Paracoccus broussonetiae TaxID=3075834 RepID=A0ABU3EF10_9RHOB|nr:YVTN family beta-propeller repeat protein [Paracoccus sp. CPCC 101403]MDT1062706.1 YVTN family beta-propeller repeat protein [Paracoccus sp. CPCC 101403]
MNHLATAILTSAICLGLGSPALANRVFVSNEKGNDVTVLDSDTLEVIGHYPVGARPRGITISPDGKELYVCVSDDDLVRVFNPETMEETHTLPSGPDPELFVLHPSGNPLYIANEDDNLVTVVDTKTHKVLAEIPVGVEPEGMGVSPDGKVVINTSETTNMAHFINSETFEIFGNVLVDSRPRFAQFNSAGTKLYVSAEIGGTVTVIDPAAQSVEKKITFEIPGVLPEAIQPVGIRVTNDGKKVFVALGPANRVAVINGETDEVEDYLLVGQRVWQMAFTPDEKFLFTTNGNSNDVSVIDVDANKVVKSVAVGQQPWGVVVAPN